MGLHY